MLLMFTNRHSYKRRPYQPGPEELAVGVHHLEECVHAPPHPPVQEDPPTGQRWYCYRCDRPAEQCALFICCLLDEKKINRLLDEKQIVRLLKESR
jgi:hypothetical protein